MSALFIYIIVGTIMLALFIPMYRVGVKMRKKAKLHFQELADELGLTVTSKKNESVHSYAQASGIIENVKFELKERFSNSLGYPALIVPLSQKMPLEFDICPKEGFSRSGWNISFAKKMGIIKSATIGDPEFEDHFYIKTNDERELARILSPQTKTTLIESKKEIFNQDLVRQDTSILLTLNKDMLYYLEESNFGMMNEKCKARFVKIKDCLLEMIKKMD